MGLAGGGYFNTLVVAPSGRLVAGTDATVRDHSILCSPGHRHCLMGGGASESNRQRTALAAPQWF